jgi:hypothetical protein
MSFSNRPAFRSVSLDEITNKWRAPLFKMALKRYISHQNNPHLTPPQLEKSLWNVLFTFFTLPIWNKVKFVHFDLVTGRTTTVDTIHANPEHKGQGHDKQACQVCGRFDTVLVDEEGHGREHGIDGMSIYSS